jgi:hypothetical protein
MKTYPLNKNGTTTAFEIENTLISRRGIAKLLRKTPGVTDVRLGGRFGSANDVRVSFTYEGVEYEVEEPFGDNARYLVGPRDPSSSTSSIGQVEAAFRGYRPTVWQRIVNIVLMGWA